LLYCSNNRVRSPSSSIFLMKLTGLYNSSRPLAASLMLGVTGALFMMKYSARVIGQVWVVGLAYMVLYIALTGFIHRWADDSRRVQHIRMLLYALTGVALLGAIAMIVFTDESSRVSRLPAITEWIERVMAGQFPWGPETRTNPSGFPVLFALALPFYYLGNIGLMEVVGVALFIVAVSAVCKTPGESLTAIIGLLALPTFYYELLVRSELLFNMSLVVALLALAERKLDATRFNWWFAGIALLFGLALSTRTIVGIIHAAYFAYKFRGHLKQGALFVLLAGAAFILTLLPFILQDVERFIASGPFAVQGRFFPMPVAILALLAAIIGGWRARNFRMLLFTTGTVLFVVVLAAALMSVAHEGVRLVLFNDQFDISYFIFAVPFLLLGMGGNGRPHTALQ
jgi:hypothetical protein